jgi:hypothetical protein
MIDGKSVAKTGRYLLLRVVQTRKRVVNILPF